MLVANCLGLCRPFSQVLVVRILLKALLEHLMCLIIELHLQSCTACSVVAFRPVAVCLYGVCGLHECLGVLAKLEEACRSVAVNLVLVWTIAHEGPGVVL